MEQISKETPKKPRPIDCFICLASGIATKFQIAGRKCTSERVKEKLKYMLHEDVLIEAVHDVNPTLCRNCLSKLNTTFSFLESLRSSCDNINKPSSKRGVTTPKTPKSSLVQDTGAAVSSGGVVSSKSRKIPKRLPFVDVTNKGQSESVDSPKLDMPGTPMPMEQHANISLPCEHDYVLSPDTASSAKGLLPNMVDTTAKVNDRFLNILKDTSDRGKLLHEVMKQSSSLLSRTVLLSSALYRYRSLEELTDHSEDLLTELIAEMMDR